MCCLDVKEIDYNTVIVDLNDKPTYFTEAYRKSIGNDINSDGKVPILKHNDVFITESNIINRYLDKIISKNPFLPSDPIDVTKIEAMYDIGDKLLSSFYKTLFSEEENFDDNVDILHSNLESFDNLLNLYKINKNGNLLNNNDISFFEICYFPFLDRYQILYKYFDNEEDLKMDNLLINYSNVENWFNEMQNKEIIKNQHKKISIIADMDYVDYWTQAYSKFKKF